MTSTVIDSWARFEAALPKLKPANIALAPGVSDAALDAFESATQLSLPAEVREWFRAHDGQATQKGFAGGFRFVSLSEMQRQFDDWADVRKQLGDGIQDLDRTSHSHPPKAIRRKYSVPGWLMLLNDDEGNAIGVDLQPGAAGTLGQVINFGRDEEDKYVMFPNAAGLMQWLAEELEAGRIVYDEIDEIVVHANGRLVSAMRKATGH